jgi:hypothetical protein
MNRVVDDDRSRSSRRRHHVLSERAGNYEGLTESGQIQRGVKQVI